MIELGGKKFQTKTEDNAGKNPKWTEEFIINAKTLQDKLMKVSVWDDDPLKDDLLGAAEIYLQSWMEHRHSIKTYNVELFLKKKVTGTIRIQFYYDPDIEHMEKASFIM